MKKLIALALTLVLALSLCVCVFADSSQDVVVNIVDGGEDTNGNGVIDPEESAFRNVISVAIAWEGLTFVYEYTGWNGTTHSYEGDWQDSTGSVTVTNHSNVAVDVTVSGAAAKDGVTVSLTNDTYSLESGVGRTYAGADFDVTTITVTGTPTASQGFTVCTLNVIID